MKKSIKELTAYEFMLAEEEIQPGMFYSIFLRVCDEHGVEFVEDATMAVLLTSRILRVALYYRDIDALVTHLQMFFMRAKLQRPDMNQLRRFAEDLIIKYVSSASNVTS